MAVYIVKLIKKEIVADKTMAFYFEKPVGFNFKPGQYADYILLDPQQTDSEGNVRSFTLACAPYEDNIRFVTRMRDTAFKRVMRDMAVGTEVKLDGPSGNLTLRQNLNPAVFITGGIGITPARSIITQSTHDKLNQKIYLFYSNKMLQSAAFIDELYKFAEINKNFIFIPTITANVDKGFKGETGHINGDMLRKYIPDLSKANYYITGPPSMVKSLRLMLIDNNVKKQTIFTEDFDGYK
jgi:ferredoxin-NADP reductase